jgi:hypothetical protein
MSRFSDKDLSKQEDLTHNRLQKIVAGFSNTSPRPTDSLIELIQWAKKHVQDITQKNDWVPYIHNKISIDGAFLQYCEECKLEVRAVHTDAITSWKTDHEDEHFVGVGIFEIKNPYPPAAGGHTFYHCGLFHKGNQNEDEVSFFVLVRKDDYIHYRAIRDGFDNWQKKRERESQEIEVVGGNPIAYDLDVTWDDVFLPDELRKQIVRSVEGFLNSKELYEKLKVPWRRGIGFWGPRGCHAKGERILMYDGSVKNVENVVVGDLLMGPDSLPRKVLELVRGQDEMFKVTPSKSDSFVVNSEHILHLKTSNELKSIPNRVNISVRNYIQLSEWTRNCSWYTLQKPGLIEFQTGECQLFDPYFIGLWLGDGTSGNTGITVSDADDDQKTIDYLYRVSEALSLHISTQRKSGASCATYNIATDKGGLNPLRNELKSLGILEDKKIPFEYLRSSVTERLELLAGLLDSDGHYHVSDTNNPSKGYFEITQKREQLSNDIVFLARSLGFRATITETTKSIKDTGFSGKYFRVGISGDIERIPVRLDRKKPHTGNPNKSHLSYGFSIESVGNGNYFGFVVDKDHLYLDGNFFIHHNCGKTTVLRLLMAQYPQFKPVTIQPGHSSPDELLEEAFEYAEEHAPALLFFEDLQELVKTIDLRHLLQLLDGMQQRAGILTIVTGNDFTDLEDNLKSRPRRFDGFFEFPLPDLAQSKKYLTKYLADIVSAKKIESIAKKAVKKKFTYSHLQEVYFNAVFIAIPEGREKPNENDIELSFKQVAEGKQIAEADEAHKRDLTDDVEYEYEREDVL